MERIQIRSGGIVAFSENWPVICLAIVWEGGYGLKYFVIGMLPAL
jgi:hypothetical protein